MNLQHLRLFLQIVEKGSLAAAGRELGLSATTVSDRLASIEAHYGVTLLNRTTRAISLTEEGRTLFEGAREVLSAADELNSRVRLGAQTLSGLIRVSAPIDLGHIIVEPVVNQFLKDNPKVCIELLLTDSYVNIVNEGIDIAVRFGNLADSTLRVKSLGSTQRLVCASPEYIEQHGSPLSPSDLSQHNCLVMRFGAQLDNIWNLRDKDKSVAVHVTGNRIANDSKLVHNWCLQGYGIAFKAQHDVGEDIKAGKLISLLEDYSSPPTKINMLFPPSRTQPLRVRELAKQLSKAFEN